MTVHRVTDIPKAELQAVIDDFELEGYDVKSIAQADGLWTVEARKGSTDVIPAPAAGGGGAGARPGGGGSHGNGGGGATPVGGSTEPVGGGGGVAPIAGEAILAIAKRHVGQKYGAHPPNYADPNWRGEFDCAEFASYCAYRTYGLLFATRPRGQVNGIESYTGYWKDDAFAFNTVITWQEALRTPGALVLRYPPASGMMGHIGICVGDGDKIYEAHSTNRGVILGTAGGRRWDIGVRLPGVAYEGQASPTSQILVYRLFDPPRAHDPVVERLQAALQSRGYLGEHEVDGIFDRRMYDAVVRYQQREGLVVDGEVGSDTGSRLLGETVWREIRAQLGSVGGPSTANHDLLTLARTIYGEARGEPAPQGLEAVANVVMNRVRSPRYPNSIAQVCLQPFQFSCWNMNDANFPKIRSLKPGDNSDIDKCLAAAARVIKGQVADHTSGALHYHSTHIPEPSWVRNSPKAQATATIGTHVFYVGIN